MKSYLNKTSSYSSFRHRKFQFCLFRLLPPYSISRYTCPVSSLYNSPTVPLPTYTILLLSCRISHTFSMNSLIPDCLGFSALLTLIPWFRRELVPVLRQFWEHTQKKKALHLNQNMSKAQKRRKSLFTS